MTTEITTQTADPLAFIQAPSSDALEAVLAQGDLAKLTTEQRLQFLASMCRSIGLNPLTRPFDFMTLQGKIVIYAKKDCTEQLRKIHNVSTEISKREQVGDLVIVTAKASMANGRVDEDVGVVNIKGQHGEQLANSMMKAITKAKRRVTLSICGLGFLDESEMPEHPQKSVRDVTEPVTKLADAKQITPEEAQHWSELLPNLYKQVFVKLHNCTVAEFVTDRDKRSEFILGRPDMPEGLEAMAADCIIFKIMEQQFVKLSATEDQVSTELNRRGVIQGSILEQDGNTLFDLQPEIQALVKEGWKP